MDSRHGEVKPGSSPLKISKPAPKIYGSDRNWSDKYIPLIREIVGRYTIVEAPYEWDVKCATDLMTFTGRDVKIAARVRRPGYFENYGHQFTMRSHRDSGTETELSKVIGGWGDWMFYAFAAPGDVVDFDQWFLVDLIAFRKHYGLNRDALIVEDKPNGDGTHFLAFDLRSFPAEPSILIASKLPLFQAAPAPQPQQVTLTAPAPRKGTRIHTLTEFQELWPAVLMRVKKKIGITAVSYLHDAKPAELDDSTAVLEFKKEFHYAKACDAAKRLPFEQVLNECMAAPHRLVFRLADPPNTVTQSLPQPPEPPSDNDDRDIDSDIHAYAKELFCAEIVGRSEEVVTTS